MILRAALLLALGAPSAVGAADPLPRDNRPNLRSLNLFGGETPPLEVLIVGAGIAGLSCGYNLDALNPQTNDEIDLRILEARSKAGGRLQNVKDEAGFIDFDLDMGGQDLFIHDFDAYRNLLSDGEPFPYKASSWAKSTVEYKRCRSSGCQIEPFFRENLDESSFRDSSLATFVAEELLPSVEDKVLLGAVVTEIDYTNSDKIVATTRDGRTFEAKQLVVAVPLSQLKKGAINFVPPLPSTYASVISESKITEGVRIWVEFSEKFYKDVTEINGRRYWDAARGKDTDQNIITIQGVKERTLATKSDDEILNEVLEDLDEAYADETGNDHVASDCFTNFFIKNWQEEEFIEMANADRDSDPDNLDILKEPVDDRIWFAGDYTLRGDENEAGESGKFVAGRVYQKHTKKPGLCEYYQENDLIVDDELCFSVSDRCEATADLDGESCDDWCARSGLSCSKAWNDGAFCEKKNEISCSLTGKGASICQCGVGLCQDFLIDVDLIERDEICSGTPQECVANAHLEINNRESCDDWCERQELRCTGAWDDGDFCEKVRRISCHKTGNKFSICRCEN